DHQGRVFHAGQRGEAARDAHQGDGVEIAAALDPVQRLHAKAASACAKQASGARAMPAPTWPMPALRCAMPVLIAGAMPVSRTRRMSMPAATPAKSSAGICHFGLRAAAISPIARL